MQYALEELVDDARAGLLAAASPQQRFVCTAPQAFYVLGALGLGRALLSVRRFVRSLNRSLRKHGYRR